MTQNEKVLKYMREHGSITALEAVMCLRILRLSARICDLRRSGHKIVGITEHSDGSYYTRYRLVEE